MHDKRALHFEGGTDDETNRLIVVDDQYAFLHKRPRVTLECEGVGRQYGL